MTLLEDYFLVKNKPPQPKCFIIYFLHYSLLPIWNTIFKLPTTLKREKHTSMLVYIMLKKWQVKLLLKNFSFILQINIWNTEYYFVDLWTNMNKYLMHAESLSHCRLFVTPWIVAHQAPLSMGFSRQEYCSEVAMPPSWDLSDPGVEPASPALAGRFFILSHLGSPRYLINYNTFSLNNVIIPMSWILCLNWHFKW